MSSARIPGERMTLIDEAKCSPFTVIEDIMGSLEEEMWIRRQLKRWLVLALISNEHSSISYDRETFRSFYENIQKLIPQFSIVYKEMEQDVDWPEKKDPALKILKQHFGLFFEKFPIKNTRCLLNDWFYSSLRYDGMGDLQFAPDILFLVWQDVSALLEAAWTIFNLQ